MFRAYDREVSPIQCGEHTLTESFRECDRSRVSFEKRETRLVLAIILVDVGTDENRARQECQINTPVQYNEPIPTASETALGILAVVLAAFAVLRMR